MRTLICPTCGCSLVRLGISIDKAAAHRHEGEEYHFCCQGCVDLFVTDPAKYLQETSGLIVCPTCIPADRIRELELERLRGNDGPGRAHPDLGGRPVDRGQERHGP